LDANSSDVTNQYTGGGTGIPVSLVSVRQDYGDSSFDIRHAFSAGLTYNIPTARISNSFARGVIRNWSLDSVISARTGTPFNVLYTPGVSGAFSGPGGTFELRPDRVLGQPAYVSDPNTPGGKELNPAAFAVPSVLAQGSEGRNDLRGFPLFEFDVAVRRQFNIREHLNLQFRAEAFNIINHPNFANPLNTIGTCSLGVPCTPEFGFGTSQAMLNQSMGANAGSYGTGFGSLYQVGGPRSLQLSMKLQF
jgi:hypothetical protein